MESRQRTLSGVSMLTAILVAVLLASPAHAAAEARHSGTIVARSTNGRSITLEELGPWTHPLLAREKRSIALAPTTKIQLVARSKDAASDGWPGGFKDSPLAPSDLNTGDHATVAAERDHGRLVARSVTVIRPVER